MRKILFPFFALILLVLSSLTANATHIVGMDLYYDNISGNDYRITMAVYGDCAGSSFPSLTSSTPEIKVYNGTSLYQTLTLNVEGAGVEVSPVCPNQFANTSCHTANSPLPGITRYIYSGTVTLSGVSANWLFQFTGVMGASSSAGRSNSLIKNIVFQNSNGQPTSITVLDATLNNTSGSNSSPRFTTLPTPYYCANVAQQYNQGSVDPNNDSLVFALASAQEPGALAVYQAGYSSTLPMGAGSAGTFSTVNGQYNFITPGITGGYVVVNRVDEYRNGVKVGSASREMTFVVLPNCVANNPPSGAADTSGGRGAGGLFIANNTYNVCEGTALTKFNINPTDADHDSIEVSVVGLPAGATAAILNNNTPTPVVNFSWNTTNVAPGTYIFYVTYKDNGCPISAGQTQAYTISVIRPNQFTSTVTLPTECVHKAKLRYNLAYGLLPRTVTIRQGTTLIRSFIDNTGVFIDSLDPGTYAVTITSPNIICPTNLNLVIRDSGIYPYPPITNDAFYCLNDPAVAMTTMPVTAGSVFWYDSLGRRLGAPPVPNTTVAGIYRYMTTTYYKVCESLKDTGLAYVTKRPTADFVVDPSPVCARDTATVTFTGFVGVGPILDYKWGWGLNQFPVSGDGAGPYRISWYNAGVYTIKLQVFENRCPSDSIEKQIRVKPKPVASFTNTTSLCQYDSTIVTYDAINSLLSGQQYAWDFDGATQPQANTQGPFKLHWETSGVKTIFLKVESDGCTDTISRTAEVHVVPEARILNVPGTVCLGDKVMLEHYDNAEAATYTWLPKDKVRFDKDGNPYTQVLNPTTYTLLTINEFSCTDTTSITYTDIQPCCKFSYPNAFTPNRDGRNDKFKVVTYGNDQYYDLSIFNRWGQRVFHTADPQEGWDGTYNAKDCDMGIFYYMFKGKCLTGYEEEQKGEFTLIR